MGLAVNRRPRLIAPTNRGAYTTFSTFAFESYELFELRHLAIGAAYIGTSVAAGIAAIAFGQSLGRAI